MPVGKFFISCNKRLPKLTLLGIALATAPVLFAQTAARLPASLVVPAASNTAYVDQVMEGIEADDRLDLIASMYNETGWPRSWRADYSIFSQSGASRTQSQALGLSAFVETPNYGAISLNANLLSQRVDATGQSVRAGSSTWRIDQRGVPLSGGWRANYSAGDINTVITQLGRGMGRVSLPTSQIRGLSGQWLVGEQIDINASSGKTGLFNGLNVTGFESLGGQISSAGAQVRLAPGNKDGLSARSDAAVQLIEGRGVSDSSSISGFGDTRAIWLSTSLEGLAPWAASLGLSQNQAPVFERTGGLRLQGNLVRSSNSSGQRALGLWADANWRSETWRNTAGIYRFEPNLRWGTTQLAGDLQGLYWAADTSTRRWQTGFSAELSDSVRGSSNGGSGSPRTSSAFFSVNGRYQLDTRSSLGAVLSLRGLNSPGRALSVSWNQTSEWGQTQWIGDLAGGSGVRTTRLGVDHSWALTAPASFNTSLALERVNGGEDAGNGVTWGLLGRVSPWSQWSLDASLRGTNRSIGSSSVNANLGLVWGTFDGWSLSLRYTEARGRDVARPLLVSALTAAMLPPVTGTPASRSVQLVLGYSARAGSSSAPLGGVRGGGAGSLGGTVFYDANSNGKREASEGGVPNITIILDRRYVTRTDTQGRYEFSAVAEGNHLLEISSDNVPLPWSPQQRDPVGVEVEVRAAAVKDFAVQRER